MTTIPETQCYIMLVNNDTKVGHSFQKMMSQRENTSTKYKDYIMKPDMLCPYSILPTADNSTTLFLQSLYLKQYVFYTNKITCSY